MTFAGSSTRTSSRYHCPAADDGPRRPRTCSPWLGNSLTDPSRVNWRENSANAPTGRGGGTVDAAASKSPGREPCRAAQVDVAGVSGRQMTSGCPLRTPDTVAVRYPTSGRGTPLVVRRARSAGALALHGSARRCHEQPRARRSAQRPCPRRGSSKTTRSAGT